MPFADKNMRHARIYSHFRTIVSAFAIQLARKWL